MIKIYNPITNSKVELKQQKISIYNCGPTVYNYVHIGNIRPLITFDVLYRYLLSIGKDVTYIHNITDIDDKIINRAIEENSTEKEISEKYTKAYFDLFDTLNIKRMQTPKVSDHIQDIIEYIKQLVASGSAYVKEGDVYFDIRSIKDYGVVSNRKIDELLDGVRKENLENKNYPLDFALWKQTNKGLNWSSPWSNGRPGWHTECSVLINKYIGDSVTIHGGGIDLKFPHHENENAQNIALKKRSIADIWMHVGHLNINNEKMAKSLKNFILVKDILTKQNANGLRWFFYKTKYENPINFTDELLNETNYEIQKIVLNMSQAQTWILANNIKNHKKTTSINFDLAMQDDLNFPNAITSIIEQTKNLNLLIRQKDFINANEVISNLYAEFDILGLRYETCHNDNIDLIQKWYKVMNDKDYIEADRYRNQLVQKGLL